MVVGFGRRSSIRAGRRPCGQLRRRRVGRFGRLVVRRIVGWYKQGLAAEEIAREIPHISLAQVYAALTYYHANREEIEADLAAEDATADLLEKQQRDATNS